MCGGTAMVSTFEQTVQRVLGADTRVQTRLVTSDPPDDDAASKAGVDGVVELSFSAKGQEARLHCYLAREKRWIDRQISFGSSRGSVRREISERGRLLGFAVATMYAVEASDTEREPAEVAAPTPPTPQGAVPPPEAMTIDPAHARSVEAPRAAG